MDKNLSNLKCYNEGYRARMDWKLAKDCPHEPNVDAWYWWQRGWKKCDEILAKQDN